MHNDKKTYEIKTERVRFGYRAIINVKDQDGKIISSIPMDSEYISIPECISRAMHKVDELKEYDSWQDELVAA